MATITIDGFSFTADEARELVIDLTAHMRLHHDEARAHREYAIAYSYGLPVLANKRRADCAYSMARAEETCELIGRINAAIFDARA